MIWSVTRRCNLNCTHCYSNSRDHDYPDELTTEEGFALLEDLAGFGVSTVVFSGGEPLMRADLSELAAHATELGLRCVLWTNGTLIDADAAHQIAGMGFSYVGVGFDGVGRVHDGVRGRPGAYDDSLHALRWLRDHGVRTGLRFTVHRKNVDQLPAIFDLLEQERIDRCCIHHLAHTGPEEHTRGLGLSPAESRSAVNYLFDRAEDFHRRGLNKEVLTDDNTADGILLLGRVAHRQPKRAWEVWQMLVWGGGNQSGIGVASIDPMGGVHADRFSWSHALGHVRSRPFSEIWRDETNARLVELRRDPRRIKGRCSGCRFLGLCNGNLRARAESYFGDVLAPDPACYLNDEECGIQPGTPAAVAAAQFPVPVQAGGESPHS